MTDRRRRDRRTSFRRYLEGIDRRMADRRRLVDEGMATLCLAAARGQNAALREVIAATNPNPTDNLSDARNQFWLRTITEDNDHD